MFILQKEYCPICDSANYKYECYKEDVWGAWIVVEQHGYCQDCGYWIEQAYSPVYEGFTDCKRGWRDYDG